MVEYDDIHLCVAKKVSLVDWLTRNYETYNNYTVYSCNFTKYECYEATLPVCSSSITSSATVNEHARKY